MPEFDYEGLSPGAKTKISALALKKGWSIEQAVEAIGIEFDNLRTYTPDLQRSTRWTRRALCYRIEGSGH